MGLPREAFGEHRTSFLAAERQRIAIARCPSMKPEIIVCDESVSALDVSVQATVLNLLLISQEEFGLSYAVHQPRPGGGEVHGRRITLVMSKGEIVERGPAEDIHRNPQHEYTKQLLAAILRGGGAAGHSGQEPIRK